MRDQEGGGAVTPRVLVVEDDSALAELFARCVKELGYEARCVECVAGVFPAIEAYDPHIMLLDIMLPDGSGLNVLKEMCERGLTLPVIVITGLGDEATGKQALTTGAFDFVTKPIDFSYLKASLACALTQSAAGNIDLSTLKKAHFGEGPG